MFSNKRAVEILDATRELYQTKSYRDINIKEISQVTSFSRPSIYNYFQSKEEIFLVMLAQEYLRFSAKIDAFMAVRPTARKEDLSDLLAKCLAEQPLMLKLISNNIEDFEEFSRMEVIVYFKQAYSNMLAVVERLLATYLTDWSSERREKFIYAFFPYLFGIYIYTFGTAKQREALDRVDSNFKFFSVYDLSKQFLEQLFKD